MLLLRDVAPDLVSIVIAQTLIAVGALCIYIGLERFVMQLCGLTNVREATLFPRDLHRLTP